MKWIHLVYLVVSLYFISNIETSKLQRKHTQDGTYKNLIKFLKKSLQNDDAKEIPPPSNEEIDLLLNKLPFVENDSICLESEACAENWMNDYNFVLAKINERGSYLEYKFETDLSEENENEMNKFAPYSNKFLVLTKNAAMKFLKNCEHWNPKLRRMLYLASLGIILKDKDDVIKLSNLSNKLESIYGMAKVCDGESDKCFSLDPDLTDLMKNSRDYDKLIWVWKGWHDATGPKMRQIYTETVEIHNKGARENNYKDLSERWIEDFEDPEFERNFDKLFAQIKPLYENLHAYVRRKLKNFYGSKYSFDHDPKLIPAHILGNMWAQGWDNIYDLVVPFPEVKQTNLTDALIKNKYTPYKMFKRAEDFFASIGLFKMTPNFWKYSMIEKPSDRNAQCHASATDFFNGIDFRIKMCTSIDDDNFYTVHHEMGHVEYYMAYRDQPSIFRSGANSAFHEAIGDTIALSVQSFDHLEKIGFNDEDTMSPEQEINFLMSMALKKIAFLPFGYLMDKWRWSVFRGEINDKNYNQKWWEMRKNFQGLEPPVKRTENDFDPGAKYHIASYTPYARYFISHFLQFQFYRGLCRHSGHTGPLHKCDFYNSLEAGHYLKKMLELGASKHWTFALNLLTNEKAVSAEAIFEYFKPLEEWLIKENSKFPNDLPGF